MSEKPTLPRLLGKKQSKYLIPNKLVQTENMIYICLRDYIPINDDELACKKDDVVCVLEWDKQSLIAVGNNVTSGKKGKFPLEILVCDDDK